MTTASKTKAAAGTKKLRVKRSAPKALEDGLYLVYPDKKKSLALKPRQSIYGDTEYVYEGTLLPGKVDIVRVKGGEKTSLPLRGDWNYGLTLEGAAHSAFHASAALTKYNPDEDRSFVYINPESELFFRGEKKGPYELTARLFGENGQPGERWVVLYLEELK